MAVYLVCYIISFILARQHFYMLSGLVLITAASVSYTHLTLPTTPYV